MLVFDYREGAAELDKGPFQRVIRGRKLISHKYSGSCAAMDTFKDQERFDMMYAFGDTPRMTWR